MELSSEQLKMKCSPTVHKCSLILKGLFFHLVLFWVDFKERTSFTCMSVCEDVRGHTVKVLKMFPCLQLHEK